MKKLNLSLSKKLLSIGGISILVTLAVVAITWGSMLLSQSLILKQSEDFPTSEKLLSMSQQFQEVRQAGFDAARHPDKNAEYLQVKQDFQQSLKKLLETPLDPKQKDILLKIEGAVALLPAEAQGGSLERVGADVEQQLNTLRSELDAKLQKTVTDLATITSNDSDIGLAVSLTGLVVILLVSVGVSRSISRSAKEVSAGLAHLSEKDLTHEVRQLSRDEIGSLSSLVNDSVAKLSGLLNSISLTATATTTGAGELQKKGQDVAEKANAAKDTVMSVAGNARNVSTQVGEVADATEQMRKAISEISSNAQTAAKVATQATTMAAQANTDMGELNAASEAINSVIETIRTVAEQTNLLALNATIEASRAGEAGRGFAVVASEVKDLALSTKSAATEVSESISKIQEDTASAIEAITEITNTINGINDYQSAVAAAIEEQTATISDMATTVVEISDSSKEVTASLGDIETKTGLTAQELQDASADMVFAAEEFEELKRELSQFKWREEA